MQERAERSQAGGEPLAGLAQRLVEDVRTLGRDHVELARAELTHGLKRAAVEAAGLLLGAMVALIGLGMACAALIPALAPVIEPLWARMLVAAAIDLVIGGAAAGTLLARLKRGLKEQVQHG